MIMSERLRRNIEQLPLSHRGMPVPITASFGIADLSGKAFRIAHMGHVNAPMVIGTLGAIEMALKALKIPHGSGGVQAAVDYLAEKVEA